MTNQEYNIAKATAAEDKLKLMSRGEAEKYYQKLKEQQAKYNRLGATGKMVEGLNADMVAVEKKLGIKVSTIGVGKAAAVASEGESLSSKALGTATKAGKIASKVGKFGGAPAALVTTMAFPDKITPDPERRIYNGKIQFKINGHWQNAHNQTRISGNPQEPTPISN